MAGPRIYCDQALPDDSEITLTGTAGQHIARALRMQVEQRLTLFNGCGGEIPATIVRVEKKQVCVRTGLAINRDVESPLLTHLGIAISRGERMDLVVQKATELGVTQLTPLFTARTGVKLDGERSLRKLRHWRQIAVSACEQCGRNRLPAIDAPQTLPNWLHDTAAQSRWVLHHRAAGSLPDYGAKPASVALLVGPEGGLDSHEIALAEQAGYQPLHLGPRVLRTETAPLAALCLLQARWGDMGSAR